ncbi:MAG: endopeptidase La [Solirubrobacteraceae bacterium]|nr:endopeptidase La [Solirubrobacteraceae bacterium]
MSTTESSGLVVVGADGAPLVEDPSVPAALAVLPLRDTVPFPDMVIPLAVGQERSLRLVDDVLTGDRRFVMVAGRDPEIETPGPEQLFEVGVIGTIARMMKMPDGTSRLLVQGGQRVRITGWTQTEPWIVATIEEFPDVVQESDELTALVREVQRTFLQIVEAVPYLPEELQLAVTNVDDPSQLSHLISSALRITAEEKQQLLEEPDVERRLRRLVGLLARELELISIGSRIQDQVQSEMDRGQREFVLRQQLRAIQEELGEGDDAQREVDELRDQLDALPLPEEVRDASERELRRLAGIPAASPEHGVVRSYLEWICALPWEIGDDAPIDLALAQEILDGDHFGLEQVKDRILEHLAVLSLQPDARGTILCLAGPPGVGKTSLGRSIARAMDRSFQRISVGGVRDEAEIRGHRRTYVGAMPGTVLRAMRDAGTTNPVVLVDEIDKMSSGMGGDPTAAMLEVLDPEQNGTFRDHFLDLPYDLSRVTFVCTANELDRIPGPLRDRMEIVTIAGYTEAEKLEIARRYLVPRQIQRAGLRRGQVAFSDAALRVLITQYTREAGVRGLDRAIRAVCRKVARQVAEGTVTGRVSISGPRVRELLGNQRRERQQRRRRLQPGVASGLAWTPAGGDVLYVEVAATPGGGRLTLTGQLGDVMRESAQAAYTWLRGHLDEVAPDAPADWFKTHDTHVHVPAGAIPKDGPSAGITIATALTSLVTGRPVRDDVAMTGEITLTGEVLPIGGLKEKALGAQDLGYKLVIAPGRNAADLEDFPESLREGMEFRFVERIGDVLELALRPPSGRKRATV